MKSLDIVNSKLKKYTFYYTGTKYFIEDLNEEELHNLKRDLEVLKLIRDKFEIETMPDVELSEEEMSLIEEVWEE